MNNRFLQIRRSVALASLAACLVIGGAFAWIISSSGHTVFGASSPVTLRIAGDGPQCISHHTVGAPAALEKEPAVPLCRQA